MRELPLIIGGGPAGAAAAIGLAQAGQAPLLVERTRKQSEKVCGDFLGADAIRLLRELGIEPGRLGAAPIRGLRMIHRHQVVEARLPFPALGLSRGALDAALRRRAVDAGASVHTGVTVRRLERMPAGWRVETAGWPQATGKPPGLASAELHAAGIFLATGKHDLRGYPRPGARTGSVGMKMYYRLSPAQAAALAETTELYLFPGGYAGIQPVEGGRFVLCLAINRGAVQSWPALIGRLAEAAPLLRDRLAGAEPLLPQPLAVAGVPYGLLQRTASDPALYRLGDQAAVIPSLTGDGIAIALHSGRLAARCWLRGLDAGAFHRRLAGGLSWQMRLGRALHRLAITGSLQAPALHLCRLLPPLLPWCASGTRIRRPPGTPAGSSTGGLHHA